MDKLNQYRVLIEEILGKYSEIKLSYGEIEIYPFFDRERDHYQIFEAGWNKYTRVFGPLIHIDILDGKIWIQHDGTEVGIANELVELGIPKHDIVLGYHAKIMRQYDGFAVG